MFFFSFFDGRYIQTAFFFKTIESFLEAAPQLVLQLSLLFKGGWTESSKLVLEPWMDPNQDLNTTNQTNKELEVLGRFYDKGNQKNFSFLSITFMEYH